MEKMKTRPDVELLAPAGSAAGLRAVISAGCDACYIGGSKFGARAYAENPEEEELCDLIDYAHLRGVKVYLTVNTLLKEDELSELAENGEAEGESTEEELAEIGTEEDETLIPTDEEPEEEFFEKELKTDDGNTYRITVRINSDSGIPENANLLVRPIEKGSAEYEEYYRRAAETTGEGILEEVRFFDISLVNPENPEEHYQPKDEASVSVSIILLDLPVEEGMVEQVIHFQEEGTNTPEVLHSTEVTRDSTTQEISFETGSFSVFGFTYKSVAAPISVRIRCSGKKRMPFLRPSVWPMYGTRWPRVCPTANSAVWRLPAHSQPSRSCCFWMSRRPV